MARGESPYQGRYVVPDVDFSGIERGGAAWGEAFKGIGSSIEKYQLDKQERGLLEGTIEGKLRDNPEVMEAIQGNEEMSKLMEGMGEGLKKDKLQKLAGFVSSYTFEQDRRVRSELLGYQRDKVADARTYIDRRRGELKEISSNVQGWIDRGEKREDVISQLTPTQRGTLADMQNILRGEPTPETDLQARSREYNTKILAGNLDILDVRQGLVKKQLVRQKAKLDLGPTVEDEAELARAETEAKTKQARFIPEQVEAQSRQLKFATSDEMLELGKKERLKAIDLIDARIEAIDKGFELQRMAALAKANRPLYEQIKANMDQTSATYNDIATWTDADGNEKPGSLKEYNKAKVVADEEGDPITPSTKMLQLQHRFDDLQRQAEQLNRGTMVDVPWPPSVAGELPFGMESFEEFKGGFLGLGEGSYQEYVEEMKSKGFSPDQIPAPPAGEVDWRR